MVSILDQPRAPLVGYVGLRIVDTLDVCAPQCEVILGLLGARLESRLLSSALLTEICLR